MTFTVAVWGTLARAILVSIAAWPAVRILGRWISTVDGATRSRRLASVLVPFLFPELLVGYAYAPAVAGLPMPAELVTAGLLWVRAIPVGVIALLLTPATLVTPSAIHCRKLQLRSWQDHGELLRLWGLGPFRRAGPAVLLMGLVTFQEFELAALLKSTSWTDWLFVQQVGGLSLGESLQLSGLPLLLQVMLLVLAVMAVNRVPVDPGSEMQLTQPVCARLAYGLLLLMWLSAVVFPSGSLLAEVPTGLWQLAQHSSRSLGLLKELLTGLGIAGVATSVSWLLAGLIMKHHRYLWLVALSCVPGLLGSLLLGLLLIFVFQFSPFALLYPTPLRWVIGACLTLLPRAILLRLWMQRETSAGQHLATVLMQSNHRAQRQSGRALYWQLVEQPVALALGLLIYWSYLDLTIAYLLAPNGLPSGIVRLYNFMHFGRTSALSAEALVLIAGPWVILTGAWFLWRRLRT